HLVGDMRSLRLDRRFDAVFVHDAIDYLINLDDLRAAMATAYMHLHPGGVALLCPSRLRESFAPAQNTAATTKEREGSATSSGHGTRSPPTRHTSSTSQPNCWWQGCSSCCGSRFILVPARPAARRRSRLWPGKPNVIGVSASWVG